MCSSGNSIDVGRELTVAEHIPQETSNSSARNSIVTIRLSDSTLTSTHDELLVNESAIESPIEESSRMVDIRLSNSGLQSPSHKEAAAGTTSEPESYSQMEDSNNRTMGDTVVVGQDSSSILQDEAKIIQRIHRQSTMSVLSAVDEGSSDMASISMRSRSDSSGTFSSLGSANVDWLELEKKEEEAPRDETSDEVGFNDSIL